jgi:uncharacterized membrane protein
MLKPFHHLKHSKIDSLSDGIFSIALTLLGLDLIGAVKHISESEDFNAGLLEEWSLLFAFFMGFFVLFGVWYEYHANSQLIIGTTTLIVWQHCFILLFAILIPFGTALLGENLNTPNMSWAVFYFGVIMFGDKPISLLFVLAQRQASRTNTEILAPTAPVSGEVWFRSASIYFIVTTAYGILATSAALLNPWIALGLYLLYLVSKVNPVGLLNVSAGMLTKGAKVDGELSKLRDSQ